MNAPGGPERVALPAGLADATRLRAALDQDLAPPALHWLRESRARVAAEPAALAGLFPAVGRRCGRGVLTTLPDWLTEDAARTVLLLALPPHDAGLPPEAASCYHDGDAEERRAVLRALPLLDAGDGGLALVEDALRSHDTRLVAAAVGPYAARRLSPGPWRHAVLTCLFTGVPLTAVADLERRLDAELVRMLHDLARERRAAGRPVPPEIPPLLEHFARR
ncbi:EboA domain-containing protein [Streptomyces sp. NPDC057002]|uniref:EboA domain-containing protein n=1 Tax=Streptomyces sp. NPDC057002 TaxID=3345992 RepID=UPI00364188E8